MISAAPELQPGVSSQVAEDFEEQYVSGVNPHWVRLLKLLK